VDSASKRLGQGRPGVVYEDDEDVGAVVGQVLRRWLRVVGRSLHGLPGDAPGRLGREGKV
jgi:hypothetical protein